MAGAGDPVGRGHSSRAWPGRAATSQGVSNLAVALTGKWLELAKEVVPRISRVAILKNRLGIRRTALFWAEAQTVGARCWR